MNKKIAVVVTERQEEALRMSIGLTLADDEVERRGATFATAYANVACPHAGKIWYTFGGYPAASSGNWQRLEWPW